MNRKWLFPALLALLPMSAHVHAYDPNRDGQYGYIYIPGRSPSDAKVTAYFSGVLEYEPKNCPGITAAAFFSKAVDLFARRISAANAKFVLEDDRLKHMRVSSSDSDLREMLDAHNRSLQPNKGSNQMWGVDCSHSSMLELARSGQGTDPRSTLALNSPAPTSGSASTSQALEIERETQRLGTHRQAEARRLVEMREAAAKARGDAAAAGPSTPGTAGQARKVCTSAPFRTTPTSRFKVAEADARADLARDAANLCRANTGNAAYSTGPVSCIREDVSLWAQTPVAQLAKRPANDPPRFEFKCSASVVCTAPKETCRTEGTVRSSGQ